MSLDVIILLVLLLSLFVLLLLLLLLLVVVVVVVGVVVLGLFAVLSLFLHLLCSIALVSLIFDGANANNNGINDNNYMSLFFSALYELITYKFSL